MGGVGSSGQDASGLFCPCVGVSSRFPLSVTALTLAVSWLLMGLDSSSDLCHLPQGTVVSWNGQGYSRPGQFQVGATLTILCFWKVGLLCLCRVVVAKAGTLLGSGEVLCWEGGRGSCIFLPWPGLEQQPASL